MPLYSYHCDECQGWTDQFFDADEPKPRFVDCDCGEQAERVWGARFSTMGRRPSEALGVHPDQIPEFMDAYRKLGVPDPEFDKEGRPLLTRQEKAKVCKAYGYYNKDAGYGDA